MEKNFQSTFKDLIKPRKKTIAKEELKKEIDRYLAEHCVCTLATCANNRPRATCLRYGYNDFTVYFISEGGGKIRNIQTNPIVSVEVHGYYSGFQSVNSLQLWGRAGIIHPDDEEGYREVLSVMKTEERQDLKDMGASEIKARMYGVKITIEKARYLDLPKGIINQVLVLG